MFTKLTILNAEKLSMKIHDKHFKTREDLEINGYFDDITDIIKKNIPLNHSDLINKIIVELDDGNVNIKVLLKENNYYINPSNDSFIFHIQEKLNELHKIHIEYILNLYNNTIKISD